MNDKQVGDKKASNAIPVVSPLLHCLAMPVAVLLRFNFGYLYLSPKSIFFPIILTGSIASFAAWNSDIKPSEVHPLIIFHGVASGMYLIHFLIAYCSQWAHAAEHDQDSGRSILWAFYSKNRGRPEMLIHLFGEPALVILAGMMIRSPLGYLLIICGIALFLKEWINAWLSLRSEKITEDALADAETRMDAQSLEKLPPASGAGREEQPLKSRMFTEEQE